MLENIKSSLLMKSIFSLVLDERKLKLIKYNKRIQNMVNISLTNYRESSGKYIIFEITGKGKEYDSNNDELIFEGEYLKGKRNGLGKEYKNDKLKFEGEYLNGKRNGIGKEYFLNGKLKFEGEYLYGRKKKGKEYDKYGKLLFEGEYINGIRN